MSNDTSNPSLSPQHSESEQDSHQDDTLNARQKRNGGRGKWMPWQDRYLASETWALRPFAQPKNERAAAWDALAARMLADSTQQGPNSVIDRTGNACRGRMKKLLDIHRVCSLFFTEVQPAHTMLIERGNTLASGYWHRRGS